MKYCTKDQNENCFEVQNVADLVKKKKSHVGAKKIDLLLTTALV